MSSSRPLSHPLSVRRSMSIRNVAALALLIVATVATADLSAQDRTYYGGRSPADGDDVLPFSGAVQVENTLYLSGMLGLEGGQVPATAEAEATNVLNGMQAALENAGMTMNDLVMVQIYSSDVADYGAFNSVYRTYFTTEFPARAFIGAGTLLFNARFEVLGVAVKR
jgi:2-iminobutanoate/2-iminopropanoate deaminase